MRSQWCREHIDKVAEECGLGEDTVSDVKRAAKFCASASEYSDCSTAAIMALIQIWDDPVRDKAISSVSNALKTIKKVIQNIERERKPRTAPVSTGKKSNSFCYQKGEVPKSDAPCQLSAGELDRRKTADASLPPPLPPDAPVSEQLKRDEILLAKLPKTAPCHQLVLDLDDEAWETLNLIRREGMADTLEEAAVWAIKEIGKNGGGI
jgi:hypothetical protein